MGKPSDIRLVYLVEDDLQHANLIARHLERFGCAVRIFGNAASLRQALTSEVPAAAALDIILPEGNLADTEAAVAMQSAATVRARIVRYRDLLEMMTQDSLTGLSNHKQLHGQLATEVARAQRGKFALSFVTIDVDNCKTVNDKALYQVKREGRNRAVVAHPQVAELQRVFAMLWARLDASRPRMYRANCPIGFR